MKLLVFTGLLCLVASAYSQDSSCSPSQCQTAATCKMSQKMVKKAEMKSCMATCAATAGVTECMTPKPETPPAMKACVQLEICSAENIANMEDRSRSGGRGGRGRRRGPPSGEGRRGDRECGGKGKGKGRGGMKMKMLERLLGDAMTDRARNFVECMSDCKERVCNDDRPECPEAEGCSMRSLFRSAIKTCRDEENIEKPEKPDRSEKCKCMIQQLAPTASTGICDNLSRFKRGGRDGRGRGGRGGRGGGRGRGGRGQGQGQFDDVMPAFDPSGMMESDSSSDSIDSSDSMSDSSSDSSGMDDGADFDGGFDFDDWL